MRYDYGVLRARIERQLQRFVEDPDERADLTQDCLIKVWLRRATFRGEAAFTSWLYRIVHNEAVSWYRRRKTRRKALDRMDAGESTERDPADRIAARLTAEQRLEELSHIDRTILEMTYVEGLNSKDVASALGMAPSSVRVRLMRLRNLHGDGEAAGMASTG